MPARWLTGPAPLIVVVAGAALVAGVAGELTDLEVYRAAGQAVIDHRDLASVRETTGLPFTYPPFAAALMVPLALARAVAASALLTAASMAALAAAIWLVLGELGRPRPAVLVAALAAGAVLLEPVWQNLSFGQVNLLLMAAVLVDMLRPDRRGSGVLLGVAAGIKLTPLVFVVLLLLAGRRAMAGRAVVSFAATVAVGFLVAPASSMSYWGERLMDATRVGPPALAHNQSVYGVLTRLLDREPSMLLWLAVAGGLALFTVLVASWWWSRGDRALATCLAALAMLVASPVAWSHHWVWAAPLVLVLWQRSRVLASAVAVVFVARPFVWLPWGEGRELEWSAVQQAVGNAYLWCALAVVAWSVHAARATAASEPGMTVGGQSQESSHGR